MSETNRTAAKKSSLRQSRGFAAIVLAAAVLIGLFGIGGAKLKRTCREAETYYNENIASDMQLRISAAQAIVEQGESALDKNDAALKTAQKALKTMQEAGTPAEVFAAEPGLTTGIGQLYEALRKTLGDDKGSTLQTTWSEFCSRESIINNSYNGYASLAQKAQSAASGFPASLIASVVHLSV